MKGVSRENVIWIGGSLRRLCTQRIATPTTNPNHILSAHALHRLSVCRTDACFWRFSDSCRRHFSRLALAPDDHRADSPPSLCVLGNDRVPSQRIRFHCHWFATSQDPARVESTIAHWCL